MHINSQLAHMDVHPLYSTYGKNNVFHRFLRPIFVSFKKLPVQWEKYETKGFGVPH